MPSIRIVERDLTSNALPAVAESTVYMPAIINKITDTSLDGKAVLLRTEAEFSKFISDNGITSFDSKKLENTSNLYLAFALILQGLPVLLHVFSAEASLKEYYASAISSNLIKASNLDICNKNAFDFKFITSGILDDEVISGTITLKKMLIGIAVARKDCVALLDSFSEEGVDTVAEAKTYFDAFCDKTSYDDLTSDDDTSSDSEFEEYPSQIDKYIATFFPSVYVPSEDASAESDDNENVDFPATFAYLMAFARSVRRGNPDWYATAGSVRGQIPLAGVKPTLTLSEADISTMQPRKTAQHCINAIQEVIPFGTIIWGNRTAYEPTESKAEASDKLYASSFLNIRVLLCDLKKVIYRACKRYTFEQNTDILWTNFKGSISPTLENMKNNSGVSGYKIIRQTTDERAKLKCKIKIIPIEAVEDFDITVELNDTFEAEITE